MRIRCAFETGARFNREIYGFCAHGQDSIASTCLGKKRDNRKRNSKQNKHRWCKPEFRRLGPPGLPITVFGAFRVATGQDRAPVGAGCGLRERLMRSKFGADGT